MMKALLPGLVVLAVWSSGTVQAQAKTAHEYVMTGIDQMYNLEFEQAAASFESAMKQDPDDPAAYFFRASVYLWSYLFDNREDQVALFIRASERTQAVAERRLDRNPNDMQAKTFLGMTYGYRAIAHVRAENIMAGAFAAKTCYDQLGAVVEADRTQTDAYLGLGLFHFIFGSIPRAGQFFVGLGGIKGDAELGLRQMEMTAAKGVYLKNDAQLILALLDIYYQNRVDRGMKALDRLIKRYPKNVALIYATASVYLDQHQPEKAINYFARVIREGNRDLSTLTALSYAQIGMAYIQKNDFQRARGYFQKFLRNTTEKSFRVRSWYYLGICFEMEGDRDNALKAYKRARRTPHGTPEDDAIFRKIEERLKNAMDDADKQLFRARNANNAGRSSEALKLARSVLGRSGISRSQQALAHYIAGDALRRAGDYREAVTQYGRAADLRMPDQKWIAAYSHYYMSECYDKLGNRKARQENLEKAKSFSGFDDERLLRFMIERDVTLID